MLLTIDIGNTTVSLGVWEGNKIVRVHSIESTLPPYQLQQALKKILSRLQKRFPVPQAVVICSVVPKVLAFVERQISRQMKIQAKVVGRDIKVPLKNNYRRPREVGQDRLVCAYAAKCLYGQPLIIIDLGTAITFDVVSRRGAYEGGMIVPGIRMSADSLFQKTALLPKIDAIKAPRALIGKNTRESILSGLFFGYGAMCCGLIDRLSLKITEKPKVIVTGGHTRLMKKFIAGKITKIDRHLVFKGMKLLSDEARKQ